MLLVATQRAEGAKKIIILITETALPCLLPPPFGKWVLTHSKLLLLDDSIMDPLSLTANVIAVVGAVRSVLTGLDKLRGFRDAPQQLPQLADEVSDFQTVIVAVVAICEDSSGEIMDPLFTTYFESLIKTARDQLEQVDDVVKNRSIGDLLTKEDGSTQMLWKQWWRKNELQRLLACLRRSRQNISAALTVFTASGSVFPFPVTFIPIAQKC